MKLSSIVKLEPQVPDKYETQLLYLIIVLFLTAFYALLMGYYHKGWSRLRKVKRSGEPKICVFIPARNEAASIRDCIKDILAQEYHHSLLEVIVVDDHSEDETFSIASEFKEVRVLKLSEHLKQEVKAYKKAAISLGIQKAGGDLILTTDADCRMGPRWVSSMVAAREASGARMVSGPVNYIREKGFWKGFQALDVMGMIGIGAAAIGMKRPLMCNGANLAYTKEAFHEVGGFEGISNLSSGDDMLLMHKLAEKDPAAVTFAFDKDAMVYTRAMGSLAEFAEQRIRWASKSTSYKDRKITIILVMVYLFNLSILLNLVLSFILDGMALLLGFQLLVKFIMDFSFLYRCSTFFERTNLLWLFLPSQALHVLYIVLVGFLSNFVVYRWKGRLEHRVRTVQ